MPATADAHVLPPIAVHWVKNNILAAVVFAVASLAVYGLRQATGAGAADAGIGAIVLSVAVVILWALAGAANGVLSGAVLQRIVPSLPAWSWIALQVGIAVIVSIGIVASSMSAPGEAPRANDLPMGAALLWGFTAGAILGAVVGGLEALVLRKVALGTSSWIAWSAAAHGLGFSLIAGGGTLWDFGTDLSSELGATALWLLAAAIGALVMLPAVQSLKSRVLSMAGRQFT
jgi:hypothetical protein